MSHRLAVPAILILAAACSSLEYDLSGVPFPVRASSATPQERAGEAFTASRKSTLWLHGLFGRSQTDVAAMVKDGAKDSVGVVDFRATASASFHDWLITHLTLGLVRIKTVTVSGRKLLK